MRLIHARATLVGATLLAAAVGRQLRAMAGACRRPTAPNERAVEHGLSSDRAAAGAVAKTGSSKFDAATEHGAAALVYLPIGPSCC
jgi:hypothetical protein